MGQNPTNSLNLQETWSPPGCSWFANKLCFTKILSKNGSALNSIAPFQGYEKDWFKFLTSEPIRLKQDAYAYVRMINKINGNRQLLACLTVVQDLGLQGGIGALFLH